MTTPMSDPAGNHPANSTSENTDKPVAEGLNSSSFDYLDADDVDVNEVINRLSSWSDEDLVVLLNLVTQMDPLSQGKDGAWAFDDEQRSVIIRIREAMTESAYE